MDQTRPTDPTDQAGFSALWAEAGPAIHAWASLRLPPMLRARFDPDDLVQEVCCRSFVGISRFDPTRGPFRAWVFGIANHVLKSALLEVGRSPTVSRPTVLDESTRFIDKVPDDATAVSRRLARDDSFLAFLTAAEDLEDDERRLLIHRGLEGLSHDEVATQLGVTSQVVRKRWERLRPRLEGFASTADLLAP